MEAGDVELNPGPPTQTNIDIHELLFSVDSQDHFGIPQLLTSLLNIFQSAPFIPSILRNSSAIDKDGVMSGNYATTHYIPVIHALHCKIACRSSFPYTYKKVKLSNSLINVIRDCIEGQRCTYCLTPSANYTGNFMGSLQTQRNII